MPDSRGPGSRNTRTERSETPTPPPVRTEHPTSGTHTATPRITSTLEPKKGPDKEPLNTRVLVSTSRRLGWFTQEYGYSVTNVVDVALQEFFARNGVPDVDSNGEIAE